MWEWKFLKNKLCGTGVVKFEEIADGFQFRDQQVVRRGIRLYITNHFLPPVAFSNSLSFLPIVEYISQLTLYHQTHYTGQNICCGSPHPIDTPHLGVHSCNCFFVQLYLSFFLSFTKICKHLDCQNEHYGKYCFFYR